MYNQSHRHNITCEEQEIFVMRVDKYSYNLTSEAVYVSLTKEHTKGIVIDYFFLVRTIRAMRKKIFALRIFFPQILHKEKNDTRKNISLFFSLVCCEFIYLI